MKVVISDFIDRKLTFLDSLKKFTDLSQSIKKQKQTNQKYIKIGLRIYSQQAFKFNSSNHFYKLIIHTLRTYLMKDWTQQQDEALLRLFKQTPSFRKWKAITTQLEKLGIHKTQYQCRQRYINKLDPQVKQDEWSDEEIKKIFEFYEEYGSQWSLIQKFLSGRTQNNIKNRFYCLLRNFIRALLKGHKDSGKILQSLNSKRLTQIFDGKKQFRKFRGFIKKNLKMMNYKINLEFISKILDEEKEKIQLFIDAVSQNSKKMKKSIKQHKQLEEIQIEDIEVQQSEVLYNENFCQFEAKPQLKKDTQSISSFEFTDHGKQFNIQNSLGEQLALKEQNLQQNQLNFRFFQAETNLGSRGGFKRYIKKDSIDLSSFKSNIKTESSKNIYQDYDYIYESALRTSLCFN